MPVAEVVQGEGWSAAATTTNDQPDKKRGCRGGPDAADNESSPARSGRRRRNYRDLSGHCRLYPGERPHGDPRPIEMLEFVSTIRTLDDVPGDTPVLERDEFPVEIGREAVAQVAIWEKVCRNFELGEQAEGDTRALQRPELLNRHDITVKQFTDDADLVVSQLTVEVGGEQLSSGFGIGD